MINFIDFLEFGLNYITTSEFLKKFSFLEKVFDFMQKQFLSQDH